MSLEDTSTAMVPPELTLIVAATRNMGIGRNGSLPWTGLKKEMAYFARVTKRITPTKANGNSGGQLPIQRQNAVIMGRKTWESIPEKFRPLKGRLNIVLSRTYTPVSSLDSIPPGSEPLKVSSFESALQAISNRKDIARLFVIGGAEIYRAALEEKETKRILLTNVLTDFECDTFFPARLDDSNSEWKKATKDDQDLWIGENVPDGVQEENGVQYIFEMYERD